MQLPHRYLLSHRHLLLGMVLGGLLGGCGSDTEEDPAGPSLSQPKLRTASPPRVLPGQTVTLSGSNFGEDADRVRVTFNDLPGSLISVSRTSILAVVPLEIAPGSVLVGVEVDGIASATVQTVTVVPPTPAFSSLSAGRAFTCATSAAQGAFCWGLGAAGQLGGGSAASSVATAAPVRGPAFTTVSAGNVHACGVTSGGAAYCWGDNDEGQLGNGTATSSPVPAPVSGGLTFTSVTAGSFYTCGLTSSGDAYCWGRNRSGQLGDGSTTSSLVPVPVAGRLAFSALSAGGTHTCGLTFEGEAFCWGDNRHGELGDGTLESSPVPVAVAGSIVFSALSAGRAPATSREVVGEHTCALTPTGSAYCWGFNLDGQLGDGTQNESATPVAVLTGLNFTSIAAGAFHSCGVTASAEAACWGANDSGQLGSASSGNSLTTPALVVGGLRFTAVSMGGASKTVIRPVRSHTCALTPEGAAYCWGRNDSGQLGTGDVRDSYAVPVPVSGGP